MRKGERRKLALVPHLALCGHHAPSRQLGPPRVSLFTFSEEAKEMRKVPDTEVWLSETERSGRLGNTTPYFQNIRWLQSYTASVTGPVSRPFPLHCGTCCVFLDPDHPSCTTSRVITEAGSREELKLINPPLLSSAHYLSKIEFQALIFHS